MIEIEAADNLIRIRPLSVICRDEITALYSNSVEMRYATGADFIVTAGDKADAVVRSATVIQSDVKDNEFVSGIYLSGAAAGRNNLAGIISGTILGKTLWIRQLAVHPGCRRCGLGTRSAGLVLQYARERYQAELAYLSVVEDNAAGLGFWSRLGFTRTKRISKVLSGDEKPYWIVIMHKKL